MSNVRALRDNIIPGQANPDIVDTLEDLLDRAKAGDLVAFAFCTATPDGTLGTGWDGNGGTKHTLSAAISMLHHRYTGTMLDGAL